MPKKVLILSEPEIEVNNVQSAYASRGDEFAVSTVYSAQDAVVALQEKDTDLLVFNVDSFTDRKLQAAGELRSLGVGFPLLSLANEVDDRSCKFVTSMPDAVLLGKPFEEHQLLDLSSKLANGEPVIQRIYPRFEADVKAKVQIYPQGDKINLAIVDLSKGGLRLKSDENLAGFEVGTLVKVDLLLSDLRKSHEFYGKVVWIRSVGSVGAEYGVQFVSSEKVFKSLLGTGF
ncbi:MAG: PilZ domain-containing protein [Bdellovibrionales bacterium]